MTHDDTDDMRAVATYMANAATMLARAVRDVDNPVVAERVRAVDQLVERWRVLEHNARMAEVGPRGGPGWPGPCPAGVDWTDWLAANNVD